MRVVANVFLALCASGSSILAQPPEVLTTDRICSVLAPIMEEKRELSSKGLKLRAEEVAHKANNALSELLKPGMQIKSTQANPFMYAPDMGGLTMRCDGADFWYLEAETSYTTLRPNRFSESERTSRSVQMELEEWYANTDDNGSLLATIEVIAVELDKVKAENYEVIHRLKSRLLSIASPQYPAALDAEPISDTDRLDSIARIIQRIREGAYSTQEEIAKDLEKISAP